MEDHVTMYCQVVVLGKMDGFIRACIVTLIEACLILLIHQHLERQLTHDVSVIRSHGDCIGLAITNP